MSVAEQPAVVGVAVPPRIEWSAVVGGAIVAAGISITLLAFGSALGLSVASTAPTWRDSSPWLWILSGLFLVFVALCSFGFGGYIAGRMRLRLAPAAAEEVEFRDSMHGVMAWALAVLLTVLLAIAGTATLMPAATAGAGRSVSGSVAGENLIATELDELFRSDRLPSNGDTLAYRRAEAARILLKTSSHAGVSADDRDYLASMVASETSVDPAEAQSRVNRVIGEAALDIHRARQAAVLQAFLIAAALLLGAAVAAFAAFEGGRDRERSSFPRWTWALQSEPWRRRT